MRAAGDPRKNTSPSWSISKFDVLEIQHFFETYKDLEPGKSVEGAHWTGRVEAEQCVREAVARATAAGLSTARWKMPATSGHAPSHGLSEVGTTSAEVEAAEARTKERLATKERPLSD